MTRCVLCAAAAVMMFAGCRLFSTPVADSELFGNYEGLEWSDDYVFGATDCPPQIQVWNSASGKLVRTYDLVEQGRGLTIYNMVRAGKNLWMVAYGCRLNLVQLNIPSGKLTFHHTDFTPDQVAAIPAEEDGTGTVWCGSQGVPNKGFSVNEYTEDGTLVKSMSVPHRDINFSVIGLHYADGKYVVTGAKGRDFTKDGQDQEGFYLVNLSGESGTCVSDIPFSVPFPDGFLKNNISDNIQYFGSSIELDTDTEFSTANIATGQECYRFIYRVTSFFPFNMEYAGIKYDRSDARSVFNVTEQQTEIYVTGRVLHGGNFSGLETGVYPSSGGEEKKRIRMPHGNQLCCFIKDGKVWFSKDIYTQNSVTLEWDKSGKPEIYMLDPAEGKIWMYEADGTRTQMPELGE